VSSEVPKNSVVITLSATDFWYDGGVTPAEKGQRGRPREAGHRDLLASIGKAIRLRRVERDMKRSELADRSGLSYAYVAEIENGTKQASSKALWQLAQALGLEPHELMALAARLEPASREPSGAPPLWRTESVTDSLARSSAVTARPKRAGDEGPDAGEARQASWFHLSSGAAPTAAATEDVPAVPQAAPAVHAASRAPVGPDEVPALLARVEAVLEGVPDERAEIVLMRAVDERRIRRIVREELDRRLGPG
jgi:transcriptional regulator with XRE-family HTH domain